METYTPSPSTHASLRRKGVCRRRLAAAERRVGARRPPRVVFGRCAVRQPDQAAASCPPPRARLGLSCARICLCVKIPSRCVGAALDFSEPRRCGYRNERHSARLLVLPIPCFWCTLELAQVVLKCCRFSFLLAVFAVIVRLRAGSADFPAEFQYSSVVHRSHKTASSSSPLRSRASSSAISSAVKELSHQPFPKGKKPGQQLSLFLLIWVFVVKTRPYSIKQSFFGLQNWSSARCLRKFSFLDR